MSEDFETAPVAPRNGGGNSGGNKVSRPQPDPARQVLIVLDEKPAAYLNANGKSNMKLGVLYNPAERKAAKIAAGAAGKVGTYDRIGVEKYDLVVVSGRLITSVGGLQGGVSHEPVDGTESIRLNGEDVYPTGERVEIIMAVGTNGPKLKTVKPGTVLAIEDVQLRGLANPSSKGTDLGGAFIPVANGTGTKPVLVSLTDRARGSYFHVSQNARTVDSRLMSLGQVMIAPVPYVLKASDRSLPNDSPVMGGGVNGYMSFLVKGEDANLLQNFAQVREWAVEWEKHLKSTNPNASPAFILQLFRKSVNAEGTPVDGFIPQQEGNETTYLSNPEVDIERSLARFDATREKSGTNPQQAIMVVVRDEKVPLTENYVRMSMEKTIDQLVAWQGDNVDLMKKRVADGSNLDLVTVKPLQELLDGGGWDIVFVPVEAYNLSPSSKQNIRDGKFDTSLNFRSFTEALWHPDTPKHSRKLSESNRTLVWNPVTGAREMTDGVTGSYFAEEGKEKVPQPFLSFQGIKQGMIETLTMTGGATSVLTLPDVKESIGVPPAMFITQFTPEAQKMDIAGRLGMMAKASRAAEFAPKSARSGSKVAPATPAAPGDDAPPTVPGM